MFVETVAQRYVVVSITGNVMLENNGGKSRELRLREVLTPQSILNLSYKSQVELFNDQEGKKYVIKVPGKGALSALMKDRQNSVMQLSTQYIAYIKGRIKSSGEISSRRYSDPATVTREVAVKKDALKEQFNSFRKKAVTDFEKFRKEAVRKYAEFLRQSWEQMDAKPARPKLIDKEVPPIRFDETIKNRIQESKPINIDIVKIDVPLPKPQPKPVKPIEEQEEEVREYVDFALYGTPLHVRFTGKEHYQLPAEINNTIVADTYIKLGSADFNNTIHDCLELRTRHQFSDWAYFQMLEAFSKECFANENEATLLMAYIAQQSGYQIRLGLSDNRLCMLYASDHMIYGRCYYLIDGLDFYVYGKDVNNLRICQAAYPKEQALSLLITQPMIIDQKRTEKRTLQSERYKEMNIESDVNQNLIDFYNSYPSSQINNNFMTRWAMYANVPFESTVNASLLAELRQQIDGLSKKEAVERLLNWVQTAFEYKYDDEIWGGDRAFFPEETLYYPYCDCEDRSILLSRIIRDLLKLKVILVYYPGHLAMAVNFGDEEVAGDYILLDNERFVICDPTYIGAGIGETMPNMDNQKATVILL